jgi:hypothetical protein
MIMKNYHSDALVKIENSRSCHDVNGTITESWDYNTIKEPTDAQKDYIEGFIFKGKLAKWLSTTENISRLDAIRKIDRIIASENWAKLDLIFKGYSENENI